MEVAEKTGEEQKEHPLGVILELMSEITSTLTEKADEAKGSGDEGGAMIYGSAGIVVAALGLTMACVGPGPLLALASFARTLGDEIKGDVAKRFEEVKG